MSLPYKITSALAIIIAIGLLSLAVTLSHTSKCDAVPSGTDPTNSMKAVVYHCYGGPEVLEYLDVDKPELSDDEILVKVHAAGVNPLDWHYMRGSPYLMRAMSGIGAPQDPRLGVDFAGTVEAVGNKVTLYKPGDEVFGGSTGSFAEYLTIRETRAVALKPSNLTFEEAAAVPIAAITALQALRDSGQLESGQSVLINGASGGVGTFAIQIAKSFGAEVTAVCSTRNIDLVRAIGADHVVDYKKQDFTKGEQRYDLILDNVGNRSLAEYRKVLKPDGTLVMVGGPKGNWIGPFKNALKALVVAPFVSQKMLNFLAVMNKEDLAALAELMQAGKMTPVIDRQFSLSETAEAIKYSESGRSRGKIVIGM